MIVVVGLGNPGVRYAATKHNVGFMAVDFLAGRHGISVARLKHGGLCGDGFIAGKRVMLVKPQTFMNDSGKCVRDVVNYYGVDLSDLFVIYDDVDIPMGTLRVRPKGSAGTHNGMRDIIYQLGEDGFPRFRVGIGGERGRTPLYDYVLSGFSGEDLEAVRAAVERCADAVELAVGEGVGVAMGRFNVSGKKKAEGQGDEKG